MSLKIAICGPGRSGKDLAGEILSQCSTLRYTAGTSKFAADVVFDRWGRNHYPDAEACWLDRHNHRPRWAEEIGEFNRNDPVALYRRCLEKQDLLTGLRWKHELRAVREAGFVDLWMWVERDVPVDPTQEYGPEECDFIVQNNGSVSQFRDKLMALAKSWMV